MKTKFLILSILLLSSSSSFAQGSAGVGGGGDDDLIKILNENPYLNTCEILHKLAEINSNYLNTPALAQELRECGMGLKIFQD